MLIVMSLDDVQLPMLSDVDYFYIGVVGSPQL